MGRHDLLESYRVFGLVLDGEPLRFLVLLIRISLAVVSLVPARVFKLWLEQR